MTSPCDTWSRRRRTRSCSLPMTYAAITGVLLLVNRRIQFANNARHKALFTAFGRLRHRQRAPCTSTAATSSGTTTLIDVVPDVVQLLPADPRVPGVPGDVLAHCNIRTGAAQPGTTRSDPRRRDRRLLRRRRLVGVLTHRQVDNRADLPAGTTSNYFRTRQALLEATAARTVELHWQRVGGDCGRLLAH